MIDNILFIPLFFLSTLLAYTIQKVFVRYKKFDDFNHRTSHNTLATKTGGISVFICLFLFSISFYLTENEIFDFSLLIPISIMFIVGVYDDLYNANFKLKFILQIIVAKIIIDQGFLIDSFHGVFGIYELNRVFSQLFTVFVFLIIVNAINFIDGIDGLAITEVIKAILIIELISVEKTPLNSLGYLVIFSLLPLYYYNFKKNKKIFLGDGGSLFLGTLISIYIFYLLGASFNIKPYFNINKALLSIIIIIYPLMDLLRVFIIRIYNKKSPFIADKNHIHHKILKIVKSHFLVVFIIQSISLLIIFVIIFLLQ